MFQEGRLTMTPSTRALGILIFDDVEVLDFCGPFEAFSVARREGSDDDLDRLYDVHVIAEQLDIVNCRNGLQVKPDFSFADHPALDMILIPGGRGTRRELDNPVVLDWIRQQHQTTELTTSVCTGSFLLAKAGLLDGKSATTHWASVDWMSSAFPNVTMRSDQRWVQSDSRIIVSAGVSAGIDMALHVIELQHGRATAERTARHMEYTWNPSPETATS
jgi:transcriptional regulator GlxA family with amidase domain